MKRTRSPGFEEFDDVTAVVRVSPNAKVHGVFTLVSPMKAGKKCEFFKGELSDGKSKVRLFGFDSGVQKQLTKFRAKGEPVSLGKCV